MKILTTIDYEIFGDGTGDINKLMIQPLSFMNELCSSLNIPLTVFYDVGMHIAFKKKYNYYRQDILCIQNQLKDILLNGHDVQLHLHSQWLDAEFNNKNWELKKEHTTLISYFCDHPEIDKTIFFNELRGELEYFLKKVNPNYECNVFRAGFFCIQPVESILPNLIEAGIKIDSSFVPKQKLINNYVNYDYSDISLNDKIIVYEYKNYGKIIEVPLTSLSVSMVETLLNRNWKKWQINRKLNPVNSNVDPNSLGYKNYNFCTKIYNKIKNRILLLSFDTIQSNELLNYLKSRIRSGIIKEDDIIVLFAHSKFIYDKVNIAEFFNKLKNEFSEYCNIEFINFSYIINGSFNEV